MKNNQIAESFIVKGDECLSTGKHAEALDHYNQCLRFASSKTLLSEAFAGRSKVYFETKQFKMCDENVLWAVDSKISGEKCEAVIAMQETCRDKLESIASADEFFQLTQPAHPKVPFIAECLEVRENAIYGRYIMTNKELQPGDIVVVEEPFYKVLNSKQAQTRCAVCLKQNNMNLFPCAKCSNGESRANFLFAIVTNILFSLLFLALFCSKKCSDSVIHRYECVAPKEESFEKLLLQRMFYQAVEITGSLMDLQKLMDRQTSSKTIMDFDLSDPADAENNKNRILATTSLAEREPWSAEAYAKYESVTQQLPTANENERDFLRQYLVRCLKSMTVNFFHFFWSPTQVEGQGFALCSLAAYFAHSCDPNVDKIDVDNKFAFVVKKPIPAGEQLFMNYDRYSFLTHSLKVRQDYFEKIYTFQCGCNACTNDYPELSKLPKFDDKFVKPEAKINSPEAAKVQYRKNCDYIKDNIRHYPCYEICSLMTQNIRLLHQIGNDLPF